MPQFLTFTLWYPKYTLFKIALVIIIISCPHVFVASTSHWRGNACGVPTMSGKIYSGADDGYRVMLPANVTEVFDTASKDDGFEWGAINIDLLRLRGVLLEDVFFSAEICGEEISFTQIYNPEMSKFGISRWVYMHASFHYPDRAKLGVSCMPVRLVCQFLLQKSQKGWQRVRLIQRCDLSSGKYGN